MMRCVQTSFNLTYRDWNGNGIGREISACTNVFPCLVGPLSRVKEVLVQAEAVRVLSANKSIAVCPIFVSLGRDEVCEAMSLSLSLGFSSSSRYALSSEVFRNKAQAAGREDAG